MVFFLFWFRSFTCVVVVHTLFTISSCANKTGWLQNEYWKSEYYKFETFRDGFGHTRVKSNKKAGSEASTKWKEVKGKPEKIISWYWKWKSTWRKNLVTIIVILRLCFLSINWLWFGEKYGFGGVGGGTCLKLDFQGQGGRRMLDIDGKGGRGVMKIEQFSWTSYVYHP